MTKRKASPVEGIEFTSEMPPAPTPAPVPEPPTEAGAIVNLAVRGCSACGGNHDGITARQLSEPIAIDGPAYVATHVFICPTSGVEVFIKHEG